MSYYTTLGPYPGHVLSLEMRRELFVILCLLPVAVAGVPHLSLRNEKRNWEEGKYKRRSR
jgi:hypothetical protein